MKRIGLTLVSALLAAFPLFSYSPVVEPDPAFLPVILDSTSHYKWDQEMNAWIGYDHRVYSYDANGYLAERTCYKQDSTDDVWKYHNPSGWHWWEPGRSVYQHDFRGNLTEVINYSWDEEGRDDWTFSDRNVFTYDENGDVTEEILYYWDSDLQDWRATDRNNYTYDSTGNLIQHSFSYWNSDISDWADGDRKVYTYDSTGNLTRQSNIYWNPDINDWVDGDLNDYTYDSIGNLIRESNFYWNPDISDWEDGYRNVYTYDSIGNLIRRINYYWDQDTNDWRAGDRNDYTYDAMGNRMEETHYYWESNHWEKDYRGVYTYDVMGNLKEEIQYHWDSDINDWQGERYDYSYNDDGRITERYTYDRNSTGSDWIVVEKQFAYWSALSLSVDTGKDDIQFVVYPNPAHSILSIETFPSGQYSIEISSLRGQRVYHTRMDGNFQQLDLSTFKNGVYCITLRSKDFVTTRKIIKL